MKLEEAINYALERGELVHLSVYSTGKLFRASFASASRAGGYEIAEAADPIVALVRALTAAPMVRKLSPRGTALAGEFAKEGHDMHEAVSMAAEAEDPALL